MQHVVALKLDHKKGTVTVFKELFDGSEHAKDNLPPGDYVLLPIVKVEKKSKKTDESEEED